MAHYTKETREAFKRADAAKAHADALHKIAGEAFKNSYADSETFKLAQANAVQADADANVVWFEAFNNRKFTVKK